MSTYELSRSSPELAAAVGTESLRPENRVDAAPGETERAAVQARAATVSQESLQVATRVKVLLGATGSVIAVTGLDAGDGSAALAGALAASLASIDRSSRVLLVDANDDPQAEHVPVASKQPGLINLLEHTSSVEEAVLPQELNNLFTLPIGEGAQSLIALLSSPQSSAVFSHLRGKYRYLLIDAGIVRSGPSGMLIASLSDGVIAGLAAGAHNQQEVREFQTELKRLAIPLLGFVLTQTT